MKRALIVWGGWDGHEPNQVAEIFRDLLLANEFEVEVSESLEPLADEQKLLGLDLIVPVWTMGKIEKEQVEAVSNAVASGVGIAGCHGGMCDAFRESVLWQFITGGNWVAHPGGDGVEYTVNVRNNSSGLLEGIHDFPVKSEQYYLHVDPAVEVLATTRFPTVKWFHSANGYVDMPVIWTKRRGHGRVYYNSLGHHADIFDIPEARESMKRGLLWAAEGKQIAVDAGKSVDEFASTAKMF
ncbi:MAG: ThuA domain-containing protein [Spirochaetota bacterium]